VTNSVPSFAERAYLKAGIGRDRLRVDQEVKQPSQAGMDSGSRTSGFTTCADWDG
jgi:hypothetical protein